MEGWSASGRPSSEATEPSPTVSVPETKAVIGGFCIIDVASRDDALDWATRIAAACRCAHEVRAIMDDPES